MKLSLTLPTALAAAFLASAAGADVTVTQAATIDSPQLKAMMQNMSPEQKAQLANYGIGSTILSTFYLRNAQSRVDVGKVTSIITDRATHKMTSLNRVSHTYSTQTINENAGRGAQASVKPTGKTKMILGHLCRDYRISMKNSSPSGAVTITGDIWAAPDLPRMPPPSLSSNSPVAAIASQWSKVAGMPLQSVMMVGGSPMGQVTIRTVVRTISKKPLSASLFAIPAGYRPGPAGMTPGMPGGMGR